MRSLVAGLIILLLIALGVALVVDRRPTSQVTNAASEKGTGIDGVSEPKEESGVFWNLGKTGTAVPSISNSATEPAIKLVEANASPVTFNPDEHPNTWLNNARKSMADADPGEIGAKKQAAEDGDPEAAFWMYLFYTYCMPGPINDWQLDAHLARAQKSLDNWLENNPDGDLPEWLANRLDSIDHRFRMCQGIDPEANVAGMALAWLEAAADSGHVPARFGYYNMAASLITNLGNGFGFPEPYVIETYRNKTRSYVGAIFEMEHPDRFFLMAQIMANGIAFDSDPSEAYAYAYAAILSNSPSSERAQALIGFLEMQVSPKEREIARSLAEDLLQID